MKRKILYVSANGYLGGAEKFVLTACHAHQNSEHFQASILFFKNGEAVDLAKKLGIPFHVLSSSFKLRHPIKLLKSMREIRTYVKGHEPQLIHNTMAYTHIVMSLALAGLSLKKIWFQHGPVGSFLDKLASLFRSQLLIFNSSYLQDQQHLTTWFNRSDAELVLKLGINFGRKREKPIFSDEMIKIGTSGRICELKGFHHIVQALAELNESYSLRPFSYSIAGSPKNENDKVYYEKLHTQIKESSLKDKVILLGHKDDLGSFYNELDVFIHATNIPEAFGLVVAEAMAHGCLVIGSNVGGVTDILRDSSTGMTFDTVSQKSVSELKKILIPILETNQSFSRDKYRALATNGRSLIHQNYSVESMMNQLERSYLSL